jgi:hypothetical protein
VQELDFVALEKSTAYEEPYTPTHRVVQDFWSVVHSFTEVLSRCRFYVHYRQVY